VGVDDRNEPDKQPGDDLVGFWGRLVMGVIFAGLYIATFGPRTGYVSGILSGVLGGAVVFLLLKEVDERRKRRRRR